MARKQDGPPGLEEGKNDNALIPRPSTPAKHIECDPNQIILAVSSKSSTITEQFHSHFEFRVEGHESGLHLCFSTLRKLLEQRSTTGR
jgi:hypothetical protein